MKRQSQVLTALEQLCWEKITPETVEQFFPIGFTAEQVAAQCGILRSNTSADLNKLFNKQAGIKTRGRPTYYLAVSWAKKFFPDWQESYSLTIRQHWELINKKTQKQNSANNTEEAEAADVRAAFAKLIGASGSLKAAIEQAEAAVLYPP